MNGLADASYKFRAGRFLMQSGLLEIAGQEIARYGKKPFIIGGPTAIKVIRDRLNTGLSAAGLEGVYSIFTGHVCHDSAQLKSEEGRKAGCDVVVCAGGGRAMDFGKLTAYYMETPVVCIPTVLSTCASYAPFSVLYTPEGRAIPGNFCYDLENASILVDLDVMAAQPARYAISGMLDAMSKAVEIRNGFRVMPRESSPLSLYSGSLLAENAYERLETIIDDVLADLQCHRISPALEEFAFINIPLTGIISALSRGVGQSALAHELYYQVRTHFPTESQRAIHGEIVGLGLIPQFYYNGEPERCEPFRAFLKRLNAPTCLSEIGVPVSDESFETLFASIAATQHVGKDPASRQRFRDALELIRG